MEPLYNIQSYTYFTISKAKVNFKKSPRDRVTISYVETRLENLESDWANFSENHKKIISVQSPSDFEKTEYCTKGLYEVTKELYIDHKSELKEVLRKLSKSVSSEGETSERQSKGGSSIQSTIKLPKIELPTFSGDYAEWVSFRDLFISLIHDNHNLDEVQKLHYLKTHLSGEAEGLLRHFAITKDNYEQCWSMLNSRFNNKKYLANCTLKRFMSQKGIQNETSYAIKELLDTSNQCLHALKNIGINIESWDLIIIYILCLKLDNESRKQWEARTSHTPDELPNLKNFFNFLEERFRSLEYLDNKVQRNVTNRNTPIKSHHVSTMSCTFCKDNHKISNCKKFGREEVNARRSFVQTNGLCFNCLNEGHSVFSCRYSVRCRFCKKKHHTLLHQRNVSSVTDKDGSAHHVESNSAVPTSSSNESTKVLSCFSNSHYQILLATALIKVESGSGMSFDLRCLIDQGSQASFITESAAQLLGLSRVPAKGLISGLGGDSRTKCNFVVSANIQSRLDPQYILSVNAYVLKNLTTLLPERKISAQLMNTFPALALADPSYHTPGKIDFLLGAEVYSQILLEGIVKDSSGGLVAQNTKLGWILSGQLLNSKSESASNSLISLHLVSSDDELKRFWELESEPQIDFDRKPLTPDEQRCEELYKATTTRDECGRYVVRLPFKSNEPICKHSGLNEVALKRFLMLERRLMKNPELKDLYSSVIAEYLELNHMERVPDQEKDNIAIYLPHHAVIRDDRSTTKVRVVFDASCGGNKGHSLNNDLLVGPQLQPELRHIVMRWRRFKICVVADIVKMYRQVKVAEADTDYQRIYWRDRDSDKIQHLRHLRVTFGTASAPYLAVRTLQQLSYDEGSQFPLVKEKVISDFYMDDFMSGCESVDEGRQIYEQMSTMLLKGGFQLQKWSSNSSELRKHINKPRLGLQERLVIKEDAVSKILGLTWNKETDEFQYTVNLSPLEPPITKRKVVSDIAKLFDPLGWLAPVIITAKIFIQRLWLVGIDWDEELPPSLLEDWLEYRNDLGKLTHFRIPRWIRLGSSNQSIELHGFSDASNSAYAAVVYIRIIDQDGTAHVSLVTSKTKVSPIRQISIPRLELCGAVLLSKLIHEVASVLSIPKHNLHAWTDSTVVLAWLGSHPSRWKTFIANRVSEILSLLDGTQWSHVSTKENPADCASRGVKPSECEGLELWKKGPTWLQEKAIDYKKKILEDTKLEERKTKLKCYVTTSEEDDTVLIKFSKLSKLIRVIAYCKRFINLKRVKETLSRWLTTKELDEALLTCVKICQTHGFKEDIENMKRKNKLKKNSKLTPLSPFIDDVGVLRVGGRLQNSQLSCTVKHPILIPHKSHFTHLLIADAHERTLHGGPQLMLNYLRSRYWVVNARSSVRHYVRQCVTCIRHSAQGTQQMMGQLPVARVTPQKPFQSSGVDYAGPISIRSAKGRGHHATKGYICVFVCMATRAIHLEIVSDMTTQSFLAAYKRFVSRRGRVSDLWSDNGTTFVGGAKELRHLFNAEKATVAPEIVDAIGINGTNWHFIPPHAPNFGGLWEAGVKSTKHHLKRVIGNSTLTFEEMTTVLCQIESCLNSRPISQISTNPEDAVPLTPGHFLVGEPLVVAPELNYESSNISTLKRWQLTQRMLQDFWRRWSLEYLSQMQHRYKWSHKMNEPNLGDVVLVKEDGLPPGKWLYGIIMIKHPGSDGITRVVTLKCKNNVIKRPISKLIILPVVSPDNLEE